MKRGGPLTDLNALTGELTPPGNTAFALANSSADFSLRGNEVASCIIII
jgi:hypothetical protein